LTTYLPNFQPRPDTALLNTEPAPEASSVADDTAKVGVVSHDFKEHPATLTSEADVIDQYPPPPPPTVGSTHKTSSAKDTAKNKARQIEREAREVAHKAEEEGLYLWDQLKDYVLRPGVAGGLVGIVVRFTHISKYLPIYSQLPTYRMLDLLALPAMRSMLNPIFAVIPRSSVPQSQGHWLFSLPRVTEFLSTATRPKAGSRCVVLGRRATSSIATSANTFYAQEFWVDSLVSVSYSLRN
jgi:hypothetical protein